MSDEEKPKSAGSKVKLVVAIIFGGMAVLWVFGFLLNIIGELGAGEGTNFKKAMGKGDHWYGYTALEPVRTRNEVNHKVVIEVPNGVTDYFAPLFSETAGPLDTEAECMDTASTLDSLSYPEGSIYICGANCDESVEGQITCDRIVKTTYEELINSGAE